MIASLRRYGILLIALPAFAFLFFQSEVADPDALNHTVDAARRLRELDARVDTAALEESAGLSLNYDALTETFREMHRLETQIETSSSGRDPAVSARLLLTKKHIRKKEQLVEGFESSNSILRNASVYLLLAANEVMTADQDVALRYEVTALLASVVTCGVDCNPEVLARVEIAVKSLELARSRAPALAQPKLDILLHHARVFADAAPRVELATRSLSAMSVMPYDDLYVAVRDGREAAISRANHYRVGLAGLAVTLIVVIVAMVVRLRRNARALEDALQDVALLNETLEARVADRTRELSSSREEYRQLLESTHAIPWRMVPGELRFAYVGPKASEIVGHSLATWTSASFLRDHAHPEDLDNLPAALDAADAAGGASEIELRINSPQGKEICLRGVVESRLDASGLPVRHGIFIDVTAGRMLETELRAAQKLESIGRLSAGIAHEINTPVQFVSDSVHYIKEAFTSMADLVGVYRGATRPDLAPAARESTAEVARAADALADTDYALDNVPAALDSALEGLGRIAVIVKSLKDFSHPDQAEKSAVDLNANIRSTITIATNEYKHVAELRTKLGDLGPVMCHGGEINQVILNLVVNAAHAIGDVVEKTHSRGVIEIRTWQDDSWVNVSVRDTGTGIPLDIRDKIFDPFFTTKEVGKGTGQGLALARRVIVDKHGGELVFESEVGFGTTFTLRLPCNLPSMLEMVA